MTNNAVDNTLSSQTGTGSFVGSTSPTITTPIIAQINDTNAVKILTFTPAATAVNFVDIMNSSAGNPTRISGGGTDAAVSFGLYTKGGVFLFSGNDAVNPAEIRIFSRLGLNFTGLTVASAQAVDITFTLPSADGSAGSFLQTNASGVWSFTAAPTGTGAPVLTSSPTITTPNIVGTATNNNAAAGSVGEFTSSVIAAASAVTLSSTVANDVTSISLTAGDWDVFGQVGFVQGASNASVFQAWISTTSATLPDSSLWVGGTGLGTQGSSGFTVPVVRISIAGTTTVYLSARCVFGSSTSKACGGIYARRRR